ncbi:anti-sigma-I factor RsgI3 [Verrucomicrobiota bacterium]|nr:anti-sigma-I factor RsgI3 [Verrucomicrobiota bacterium]
MPLARVLKIIGAVCAVGLIAVGVRQGQRYYKKNLADPRSGEVVYREDCLRCHGPMGQGVAGKSDEPLLGEKSVAFLAKYIARDMPEDDPGTLSPAEALASAQYIHDAFYSAEARARNNPPRLELAHLTERQYRESVTDLLGSFRRGSSTHESGGLAAVYRGLKDGDSTNTDKNEAKFLERVDPVISFDFGTKAPAAGSRAEQFKINWSGSLLVPDTGEYDFRVTTPNGVRVYVNPPANGSEKNALIDLWVSSAMLRSGQGQVFLLGGRSYPLKVEFFKYKDKTASIKLEWRPPGGAWTVIPAENLSPKFSASVDVVSVPFPPDDASMGYERGVSVSREWTEAVAKGGLQAAALLAPHLHEYAGTTATAPDRAEKLKAFTWRFAQLAYRRPLTVEQKADLAKIFVPAVTPEIAARRAILHVLSSPHFLYPATGTQDDYAVATRLALALWDSLPDEALLKVAAQGALKTPEQVRAQAQRMQKDPRAKAKLRDFLHHWLHVEEGAEIAKDQAAYPGFDPGVVMDLRTSLDLFVEDVVWSEASDYRQLLLSDTILMNERLAKFYGQKLPEGHGFRPVKMDAAQRAGVLTHPYLLATFSYTKSTSPIHRGVFLSRNILGRMLKPPPMAIAFMDDKFDPSFTMREKVTELTAKPACQSCHITINPLGFSFERFDAVGRIRETDNAKPVNTVSPYIAADGTELTLTGARDVAVHAAESLAGQTGFVRNLFQTMVKQPTTAYSPELLSQLTERFRRDHCHVRNLAIEVAVVAALQK